MLKLIQKIKCLFGKHHYFCLPEALYGDAEVKIAFCIHCKRPKEFKIEDGKVKYL